MSQISPFCSQPQSESPQLQLTSPTPELPWLIVGLGTPGKKNPVHSPQYGGDLWADVEAISMNTIVNFNALFGKGLIGHVPAMLAKSQTSMNASDESVYEDIYLPFGTLRFIAKRWSRWAQWILVTVYKKSNLRGSNGTLSILYRVPAVEDPQLFHRCMKAMSFKRLLYQIQVEESFSLTAY